MDEQQELTNVCIKCLIEKPYSAFGRKHDNVKGIDNICKECKKIITKNSKINPSTRRKVKAKYKRNPTGDPIIFIKMKLLHAAKIRARDNNRPFTITIDDIPDPPEYCPVFPWLKLASNRGGHKDNSITLDRINSNDGYVPGNVQIISFRANTMKSDRTLEEQECLVKYMREQRRIRQKQFLERIDQIEESPCQSNTDSHQETSLDQQASKEKTS